MRFAPVLPVLLAAALQFAPLAVSVASPPVSLRHKRRPRAPRWIHRPGCTGGTSVRIAAAVSPPWPGTGVSPARSTWAPPAAASGSPPTSVSPGPTSRTASSRRPRSARSTCRESNPDVVYVGTGSAAIRSNVIKGLGVYKSTDAGRTWTHIGLREVGAIGAVRVHPTNPDLVYVAAVGPVFVDGPQRGIFRSRDGGRTWEKVLFINERTGVFSLVFDPSNPDRMYAAAWRGAAQALDDHQRRAGCRERHLHVARRRQHLDAHLGGAAHRPARQDRHRRLARQPAASLRHRRGGRQQGAVCIAATMPAPPGRR